LSFIANWIVYREEKGGDGMFSGKRLSELRVKRGLTQLELAEKLGVSFHTILRWEKERRFPDVFHLSILADVLETSVAYLMGEKKNGSGKYYARDIDKEAVIAVPLLDSSFVACAGWGFGDMEGIEPDFCATLIVGKDDIGRIGGKCPYAVKVEGDSMQEAGIPDGARISVNPEEPIYNGDAVLVKWGRRGDLAVKWYYEYNDRVELRSSNPAKYPPIIITKEEIEQEAEAGNIDFFRICGKVMVVSVIPKRGI
jgi:transcriptional regulator with XRE-family HTH domain